MEDLLDRISEYATDLPIGLIIFLVAIAFSIFGRDGKEKDAKERPQHTPKPAQGTQERPEPYTFASDERRAREEREREEVLVFGGLEFGSSDSFFRDDEEESQWGKTKYGFDDSEWGSAFGERKSSEPIIR